MTKAKMTTPATIINFNNYAITLLITIFVIKVFKKYITITINSTLVMLKYSKKKKKEDQIYNVRNVSL